MITYRREGGRPPPDNESLDIQKDGSFELWRTIARASNPPGPVGSFAGRLTETERSSLSTRLDAVSRATDVKMPFPPDSAIETIHAAGRIAVLPHSGSPGEPGGALVARVRSLLMQLTDRPQAAIALRLGEGGRGLQLVHLGEGPLLLDLSRISVRAILWEGYEQRGTWNSGPVQLASGPAEVGKGWSKELPFAHGLAESGGARIRAYVDLRLQRSGRWLDASLQTA